MTETKKINPHKLKTMKNSLMRICILIGLSLGLLLGRSSYAASRRPAKSISRNSYTMIRGSEHIVTRTKEAPAFHAIHASRAVEVIIGGTDEIVIKANDNVIDYVVVEPENGTLRISIADRVNIRNMDVTVRIPNNGEIRAIEASSAAEIRTESALKASDMNIRLSSAASLDIALKAERCTILLSSGTDLKAAADLGQCNIGLASGSEARFSGKVEAMVAKVSSGAELNAFGMVARMCEVDVASGAEAEVNCSEKLTARASSGGSVKYKGDCQVARKVSSGGEVKKR